MNDIPRSRGRPRTFDRDEALKTAMLLFWRHGYDGVPVAQLAAAMGIATASLYVAFGSKETLYREALQSYLSNLGRLGVEALEGSASAREGVRTLLHTAASAFTRPGLPPGCMVGVGALRCAEQNRVAEEATADLRSLSTKALSRRIERARRDGELGKDVSVQALTDFYGTVIEGMSVQACDGVSRERLVRVADAAMTAWPAQNALGRRQVRAPR